MSKSIRVLCALSLVLCTAGVQAAAAFSQIFVFGDSLSDNGNDFLALGGQFLTPPYTSLVPSKPYASETFSNGKVWVNFLDQALTGNTVNPSLAGGTDFAVLGLGENSVGEFDHRTLRAIAEGHDARAVGNVDFGLNAGNSGWVSQNRGQCVAHRVCLPLVALAGGRHGAARCIGAHRVIPAR